jgi:hypothetical protein
VVLERGTLLSSNELVDGLSGGTSAVLKGNDGSLDKVEVGRARGGGRLGGHD